MSTKKVLLVDDSERMRWLVRRLLQAHYQIIEACDGPEALELLRSHTDLALVICDVHMPGMNGLEVLKQARLAGTPPPVLMLTSEASPDLIAEAKQVGVKAWLVKPFKSDLLLSIVKKLAGDSLLTSPG